MSAANAQDALPALWVADPAEPLTAEEAAVAAAAAGAASFGVLSSPTRCLMVRCEDGVVHTADGPASLDVAFTLRLFSPSAELRWVHEARGRGPAVLLGETDAAPDGWTNRRVETLGAVDGRYALWGRRFMPHPDTPRWARALEGRIGYLDIPAEPPEIPSAQGGGSWPSAYLELRTREYLGQDADGNAFVCEERLLDIVPAAPEMGRAAREAKR